MYAFLGIRCTTHFIVFNRGYPDFCSYGSALGDWGMKGKEVKIIPTFFLRKPVFISFLSKGRDNSKVGITTIVLSRIGIPTTHKNGLGMRWWPSGILTLLTSQTRACCFFVLWRPNGAQYYKTMML